MRELDDGERIRELKKKEQHRKEWSRWTFGPPAGRQITWRRREE